jgi:AcrR family transcriptional regulator
MANPGQRATSAAGAPSRGRGRPAAHDSEQTRGAIIRAAQRLFGQAGYSGVAMESIASEAGVNVRALYYHYSSKRELFEAATQDAFTTFGDEVVRRVFVHDAVRPRVAGYLEVYRTLHDREPHLLPFIGMVLVDALASPAERDEPLTPTSGDLARLLEVVVDDAIARGEVSDALDRDGAVMLLSAIGMGLALVSLGGSDAFPDMLDALQLLNDGELFLPPD